MSKAKKARGRHIAPSKARAAARRRGELASVKIASPAVRAKDVDHTAVRRAARNYFLKHPKVLERTE